MSELRRGWTTGACATAACSAACSSLFGGTFTNPVTITLPRGERPSFPLILAETGDGWARAGVVKDAGDDPDVTHGATILVTVRHGSPGSGVTFLAGIGVGIVTRPGLPLAVGEPAINPVPRRMMTAVVEEAAAAHGIAADFQIEIAVEDGVLLAERTWNPRLGIIGGLSILGTTGVVVPYSCSAWIHAIQRGIDVARASGILHVAGCVGNTSELAIRRLRGLPEEAIIDMGDFVGGMLGYLRKKPIPKVTLAGGFAKFSKMAAGHLDLHVNRSRVDLVWLAGKLGELGASAAVVAQAEATGTALGVLKLAISEGLPLGGVIALEVESVGRNALKGAMVELDVVVFDRDGGVVGDSRYRSK